jgi:hypothetical protein
MSSGDQMCPCTVCGELGHWESKHAGDAEHVKRLTQALHVMLDSVDYIKGNCQINSLVGAVLSKQAIELARQAL